MLLLSYQGYSKCFVIESVHNSVRRVFTVDGFHVYSQDIEQTPSYPKGALKVYGHQQPQDVVIQQPTALFPPSAQHCSGM